MKSMTGYGEAAAQGRHAKIGVQARSLNHRHLDIQLRSPREYLSIEDEIRKVIRQKISRGRVELFITRSVSRGQGRMLELDEELLGQYVVSLRRAKRKFGLKGEVDMSLCSKFPELFQLRESEVTAESERNLLLRTLHLALQKLERSREREGRHLTRDVRSQVRHLRRVAASLSREAEKVGMRLRDSLETQGETTEIAGLNFKSDIHEEVVRLQTHIEELTRVINSREPVGKKIDFLLQEVQRELNTIGSKGPHLPVVRLVLAGKERVEKIREQAQNVE